MRASASAAFAFTEGGEERVALIAEVAKGKLDGTAEELAQRLRLAVAEELELRLDVVVLIAAQTLPKTSSGKIERRASSRLFLNGELEVVGSSNVLGASGARWAQALA